MRVMVSRQAQPSANVMHRGDTEIGSDVRFILA